MMTATDFIKAKGTKVYEVSPYNFLMFSDGSIRQSDSGKPLVITIIELTVETAGKKRVTFRNYTGEMSKFAHWNTFTCAANDWFTNLDDAIAYAHEHYAHLEPIKITLRHSEMTDWAAYCADTVIPLN